MIIRATIIKMNNKLAFLQHSYTFNYIDPNCMDAQCYKSIVKNEKLAIVSLLFYRVGTHCPSVNYSTLSETT